MSLRRNRVHHCGMSNVDYRTKNDIESLQRFQPWKDQKNFGSMGYIDYHLPHEKFNELFEVSKELNTQKDLRQESPDPKVWSSAKLYKLKNINLNKKNMNVNDKLSELDESIKGKDKYIGDSMMISDIYHSRFERRRKLLDDDIETNKDRIKNKILLKKIIIKPKKSLLSSDDRVDYDANRIKDIRMELRRRYENRNSMQKVFKEWDLTLTGEVSVYDIHSMINNRLNIPINIHEAQALVDYSNKRRTNALNIEEFIHLIYSNESIANNDNTKEQNLIFKSERSINETSIDVTKHNAKIRNNIIETNKILEYHHLKRYLRTKTNTLVKTISDIVGSNEERCNLETLTIALRKLPLQEIYIKDSYIKALHDEYIDNDSQQMNYKLFIDDCINNHNDNRPVLGERTANRTIKLFKDKISNLSQKLKLDSLNYNSLNNTRKDSKNIIETYQKQIKEKRSFEQRRYYSPSNEINSCQPSLEFINKIFCDRKNRYQKYNEIENSFRSLPSIVNVLSPKTRFNANPPIKNTALNVQADERSFMYLNENDRFNIRDPHANIVQLEKEAKYSKRNKKLARIAETMRKAQSSCNIHMESIEQKDLGTQIFHTKKYYEYEQLNRMRNEVFEE